MRIAVTAALFALSLDLQAAERPWHSYREVCQKLYLDKFYAEPRELRDKLLVRLKIARADGDPAPPALAIAASSGRIELRPDAAGYTEFPVNADLLVEDPPVLTDAPAGRKLSVSLSLQPVLPSGNSFAYADLMGAVEQANAIVETQAGALSWLAPRMKGVLLQYARAAGQTARIGTGDAAVTITAGADGTLRLPLDQGLLRRNPPVILSQHPDSADFID
jgi:hypothetical protein